MGARAIVFTLLAACGPSTINPTPDASTSDASTDVTPPPDVASDVTTSESLTEPTFDSSTGTMLFQTDFENYTYDTLHPPCGSPEPSGQIIDHSWYYCTTFTPGYDSGVILVAGHSSNNAAQFHYAGVSQESHGVVTTYGTAPQTGKATTLVQYWAKFQNDAGQPPITPTSIIQIKNIMLWHENNRFQIDLHGHGGCPTYGPSYTMLGIIDQTQVPCDADQPIGPFLGGTLNQTGTPAFGDGDWHRWTILYKPNTAQGSRDARALLWIDGTLTNRIEAPAINVTPAGGWKEWCTAEDVDEIYWGDTGVISLEWGGPLTVDQIPPFTVTIDDVKWWKLN